MRRAARSRVLAVVGLALGLLGCYILGISPLPTDAPIAECFVTVRNPAATAELGAAVPEVSLFSRGEPFLDADGTPSRVFYVDAEANCPGDGTFGSLASVTAEWSRFANQRIGELAAAGDAEDPFGRFPGEWCQVAGTLRCEQTAERLSACPTQSFSIAGPELPVCPEPEPEVCLSIRCDGAEECSEIDFGEVGVGERLSRTVELANCGGAAASPVEVEVDGSIFPIAELADFAIPVGGSPQTSPNTCHPALDVVPLDPGETCSFRVDFEPEAAGEHRAQTAFPSNARPEPHRIGFSGRGLPGTLAFEDVSLARALADEDVICFDGPPEAGTGCTTPRVVRATNAGVGRVSVTSVRVEPAAPPVPPEAAAAIEAAPEVAEPLELVVGESLDLEVRLCDDVGDATEGRLVIDSDDPDQPTFVLRVGRRPTCPPGTD